MILRAAVACALLNGSAAPAATVIHAGRVIDGVSAAAATNQTVVVDAGKIVAIEPGFHTPGAGDRVIDLRNGTLLPGLIDMHVHLTGEYSNHAEIDDYKLNEADVAIDSVVYAERTLLAGFTTLRDLGDEYRASISLRNAINAGKVPGPRIVAAGKAIASTGGHADPTNGMPAMEAIRNATAAPARLLDIDDRTGGIAVGKLGELVGVPGDPLKDITVMKRVVFVMKDDTVYKSP